MSSSIHGRLRTGAGSALLIAVAALRPAPARADEALRCTIPFSFTVNTRTLPPGTYRITKSDQGVLLVEDQTHGAFAMSSPLDGDQATGPKLVFHRYGDEYVLREVWTGYATAWELPEPPLGPSLPLRHAGNRRTMMAG